MRLFTEITSLGQKEVRLLCLGQRVHRRNFLASLDLRAQESRNFKNCPENRCVDDDIRQRYCTA